MRIARKTARRIELIDNIADTLKGDEIYTAISAGKMSEAQLKKFTYPFLLFGLKDVFRSWKPHARDSTINSNAKDVRIPAKTITYSG